MNFPSILDIGTYRALLEESGCHVEVAEDTGRYAPHIDLYRNMIMMQLTYDALKIVGFDTERMRLLEEGRGFVQELAHADSSSRDASWPLGGRGSRFARTAWKGVR